MQTYSNGGSALKCRDAACERGDFTSDNARKRHEDIIHPVASRPYGCRPCDSAAEASAEAPQSGFFSASHLEGHRRQKHKELSPDDVLSVRQASAAGTEGATTGPAADASPAANLAAAVAGRDERVKAAIALFEDYGALQRQVEDQAAALEAARCAIDDLRGHNGRLQERLSWCAQAFGDAANSHSYAAQVACGNIDPPGPIGALG